jgi:hypothetical protein
MRVKCKYLVAVALLGGCDPGDEVILPPAAFIPEIVQTFSSPPGGFVAPIDLAVSEHGVWALDLQQAVIHAFRSEGRYHESFARPGGGPGELAQPSALGIAGDTLWILNGGNTRIEYYTTDGRWIASQQLPTEAGAAFHMVRSGNSFYATSLAGPHLVLRLSANPADSAIITERFGRELVEAAEQISTGGGAGVYRLALVGENLWVLHTVLPLVGIYDLEGAFQRLLRYPTPAGPNTIEISPSGKPAPAPRGSVAAWHVRPGTVYLLTQQESPAGMQRIVVASETGELLGITETPVPLRFAFGVVDGTMIHAFAINGDTHETSLYTLRVPASPSLATRDD